MAVSTSVTNVLIPGFDATLQAAMDEALNTNSQMLDLLLNSSVASGLADVAVSVGDLEKTINTLPSENALPTFAIWSNRSNEPQFSVIGSDLQPMYSGRFETGSEIGQAFTGQNYTSTNFGSGGVTTSWVNATPYNQADGNWLVQVPGSADGGGLSFSYGQNQDYIDDHWPYFGPVISREGQRPYISMYQNGSTMRVYTRGTTSYMESLNINSATYATWAGTNNNVRGSIGYNARTNTIVVLEARDGSCNYRMHIWQNVNVQLDDKDYNSGMLHTFLRDAKIAGIPAGVTPGVSYFYNDFQWNQTNSANYDESRYKVFPTVGDNGVIGMSRFVPSHRTQYATFVPDGLATSGTLTTRKEESHTTSYGSEQGIDYGMRYQRTWDNNWIACYAPYYYYGSGMCVIFSNAKDPEKYYSSRFTGTSNGCQLVPFKKDKFIFRASEWNANGNQGMFFTHVDLGGIEKNGISPAGTVHANGASISLTESYHRYNYDTRYTSTNYPGILPVKSWTNG